MNKSRIEKYLLEKTNKLVFITLDDIILKKIEGIKEIRGEGLMIGIEMKEPVAALRKKLLFEILNSYFKIVDLQLLFIS